MPECTVLLCYADLCSRATGAECTGFQEMSRIHGYRILNLILTMKYKLVNLEVMNAVFMIATSTRTENTDITPSTPRNIQPQHSPRHKSAQLLVNALAFSYILLDFTLWVITSLL